MHKSVPLPSPLPVAEIWNISILSKWKLDFSRQQSVIEPCIISFAVLSHLTIIPHFPQPWKLFGLIQDYVIDLLQGTGIDSSGLISD